MTIDSGKTLTINPGAILKLKPEVRLTVNGILDAQGTAGNEIYFTSYKDDSVGGDTNGDGGATSPAAGDWDMIKTNAGGSTTLARGVISYGGYVAGGWNTNPYNEGILTVSSVEVATSIPYGIWQTSGTSTITSYHIHHNGTYGVKIEGGFSSITQSSIHNHNPSSGYGVHKNSSPTMTAENNYWGASDGPSGVGPGSGDRVSSNVDYDPFATSSPF